MFQTLRRRYYWRNMALDCYTYVAACEECAKQRTTLQTHANKLQLFTPSAPLEDIAMDLLGPLVRTSRGNRYILVVVDRFSKLVRTIPMKSITSASLARVFVDQWVTIYGSPSTVLTDNASNFRSRFMLETNRLLGIQSKATTTYHPQANGQTERHNRTLLAALKKYTEEHPKDWDLYVHGITYAYNNQVHTSTGVAPFELVLSRQPPRLSVETERGDTPRSPHTYKEDWSSRIHKLVVDTQHRLDESQQRMKRNFDARLRRRTKHVQVGDTIVLKREKSSDSEPGRHKLSPTTRGPFTVTKVKTHTVVIEREGIPEEVSMDRIEVSKHSTNARDEVPDGPKLEPGVEGYVIDNIVDHVVDEQGDTRFKIKWYNSTETTWEPTSHLPLSHIARYTKRMGIPLPRDSQLARDG